MNGKINRGEWKKIIVMYVYGIWEMLQTSKTDFNRHVYRLQHTTSIYNLYIYTFISSRCKTVEFEWKEKMKKKKPRNWMRYCLIDLKALKIPNGIWIFAFSFFVLNHISHFSSFPLLPFFIIIIFISHCQSQLMDSHE